MILDEFTLSYLTTALFNSNDKNSKPLANSYSFNDIALVAMKSIVADCKAYQEDNASLLTHRHCLLLRKSPLVQGGHDFYLARNGEQAFNDSIWKTDASHILNKSANIYGFQYFNVSDDGKIYVSKSK